MKNLLCIALIMLAANISLAQWQPDVRLTNNPAGSWTTNNNVWNIASSGDSVHAVWEDDRDGSGNGEVYYKRSTDGGLNWGADTRLTNNDSVSYGPCVVLSGPVLRVVWEDNRDGDYEIYYKQSVDAGLTWGADTRLTNSPGGSFDPCIAVSGSVVHVVWDDLRNATGTMDYEIYYKCSTDGGLSWGPDTRLTNNPSYCGYPCIVATGPVVQVVWEDDRDGNGEIYYKRSTDAGLTWGADTRLTNDLADSWDPCIVVNGSVMHLVWMDMRDGNYEVYYKRSEDGGISWGDDTRLTNASGESQYPNIAVSGPNVHLVWPDARDGNFEIYYKQSTDGGLTWGLDTRLTSAVNASQSPSVSASGSVVHAIWYDKRSGNNEIYYKRNPTGNTMVGFADNVANNSGPQSSIYPNPASGKTCIKFNQDFKGVALISVYNVLGERMIHRETMTSETIIDVSCLQKGVYFVGVTLDNKPIICNKLIVSGKQ